MNTTASSTNGASPINGDKFTLTQAATPVMSKTIFALSGAEACVITNLVLFF
jgi:hypothetical protein